jgi:predicted RNA methylase
MTDGAFTIEVYRLLPAAGEPEIIHAALPAGATVLDLGSGNGRIAHALLDLGHPPAR